MTITLNPQVASVLEKLGFVEHPFSLIPDTRYLYLGSTHAQAIERSLEMISKRDKPIGEGKTIIAQRICELLTQSNAYWPVYLHSYPKRIDGNESETSPDRSGDVLDWLAQHFGQLIQYIEDGKNPQHLVFILDNVDLAAASFLEYFKSRFCTKRAPFKKVSLLMFSSWRFARLKWQLPNFIWSRCYDDYIGNLELEETRGMLQYRCIAAGGKPIFSESAEKQLYQLTHGNPGDLVLFGNVAMTYLAEQDRNLINPDDLDALTKIINQDS
jgi:hypothetical protein